VMEKSPHVMMAGEGAEAFAKEQGGIEFVDQKYFYTDRAWKALQDALAAEKKAAQADDHHGTVGAVALDQQGNLAAGTSTGGLTNKRFGRIGDSPIIGHGLYVDPDAGAATATGAGELIMGVCGSFLAVESMRRGEAPQDALRQTLQRIIDNFDVGPEHQVAMIALRPDGTFASAALRPGYRTSVRMRDRDEVIEPELTMLSD